MKYNTAATQVDSFKPRAEFNLVRNIEQDENHLNNLLIMH